MKKIILIMFLVIRNTFSYEINGSLENLSKVIIVDEGQAFMAHVKIWPIQSAIKSEIKSHLLKADFLSIFKVSEIQSIRFSKNNREVLEIKLSLITVKPFDINVPHIWSYKGLNIPFEFINLEFGKKAEALKEFRSIPMLDSFTKNKSNKLLVMTFLGMLVLVIMLILGLKKLMIIKNKKKQLMLIKAKWNSQFELASQRRDYELIYCSQKEWIKDLGIVTPPIQTFFKIINNHQFKEHWTEDDYVEVTDAFDEIKNIFA